jgi:hypothetical protein
MYSTMPSTQHEVTGYDVHPLPAGNAQNLEMVLNTSGKVKIGDERGKNLYGYSAVFILKKNQTSNNSVYVSSMSYRLNYKPEDSTLVS